LSRIGKGGGEEERKGRRIRDKRSGREGGGVGKEGRRCVEGKDRQG
jgi:hypothetical protein